MFSIVEEEEARYLNGYHCEQCEGHFHGEGKILRTSITVPELNWRRIWVEQLCNGCLDRVMKRLNEIGGKQELGRREGRYL
jgi:hypothetical protein